MKVFLMRMFLKTYQALKGTIRVEELQTFTCRSQSYRIVTNTTTLPP